MYGLAGCRADAGKVLAVEETVYDRRLADIGLAWQTQTAGMLLLMNCFGCAADLMNSALFTFNAGILTSLTYRAAQLLRLERNGRLDRRFLLGRANKDEVEYRIDVLGCHEAELTADGLVDILKVALIVCRDNDGLDPGAQRAHGLFTQPAYRQDAAAAG